MCIILISIILSLYSGSLDSEGLVDRVNYFRGFLMNQYYGSLETILDSRTEPGYIIISMIIREMTSDWFWFFFSMTFIVSVIHLYTLSNMSFKYTSVLLLYMLSSYFFLGTYLLKQALALSFANLAILSYLRNQSWRYFLFSCFSCAFHFSAIILFPVFFIFKHANSINSLFILVSLVILLIFLVPLLSFVLSMLPSIEQYLYTEDTLVNEEQNILVMFKGTPFYFITILALIKRKELRKIMNESDVFVISSVFFSISWILTYHHYWIFRIGLYFMLPTLVLIPMLLNTIKEKNLRFISFIIIYIPMIAINFRSILLILR